MKTRIYQGFKPKKQKYGGIFRISLSESKDEKGENHIKKNGPIFFF